MTSDKKWREFWLLKTPAGEMIEYDEPMGMDWKVCSKTLFIEKAALDETNAKIKRLEKEHSILKEILGLSSINIESQEQIIDTLKGALRKLLKAYNDVCENDDGACLREWRKDAEEEARKLVTQVEEMEKK